MCYKVLLGIWKWKQISLFWCKWYTNDPRCMYGELPHTNVGCKCSLLLDSKCQLRKFKYVCRSWKGMGFHSFRMNAINMFHGIVIVDDASRLFNGNCHNPSLRLGTKASVTTPLWGKCEDETHTPESENLESSGTPATSELDCRVKTPCLEVFFIPLKRPWSVDVENGLTWAIRTSTA
jgi:hypothetical protein